MQQHKHLRHGRSHQDKEPTPLLYVVGPSCRPPFALSAVEASRSFVHHLLKVTWAFWPDTTAAMKAAENKLRVLGIDEHFKSTPSSRNEARFKLLLVPEDDHNCTSNVSLVEGRNVLWVRSNTQQKYSALAFFLSSS
jgi:hypothetical protein